MWIQCYEFNRTRSVWQLSANCDSTSGFGIHTVNYSPGESQTTPTVTAISHFYSLERFSFGHWSENYCENRSVLRKSNFNLPYCHMVLSICYSRLLESYWDLLKVQKDFSRIFLRQIKRPQRRPPDRLFATRGALSRLLARCVEVGWPESISNTKIFVLVNQYAKGTLSEYFQSTSQKNESASNWNALNYRIESFWVFWSPNLNLNLNPKFRFQKFDFICSSF